MVFGFPIPAHVELFIGAALALLLIPGPAVLYLVGRSIEYGRTAGFISILGIHAATLVHVGAAALGLSALLASSALAFALVTYAGAAYLIWLGVMKVLGPTGPAAAAVPGTPQGHADLFREGFVVNLLNPKTALFFLAFLPQFVDPGSGQPAAQFVVLGVIYTLLGLATDGAYAMAAGVAGTWLKRSRSYLSFERHVSGGLLIGLGLSAAFSGTRRN